MRPSHGWVFGPARHEPSVHPVERLTAAAVDVVAAHLWNYTVPESERRRLGTMRNLKEARASLELRRRDGQQCADRLSELDSISDEVDRALVRVAAQGGSGRRFADRAWKLRLAQVHALHHEISRSDRLRPELTRESMLQLESVYLEELLSLLGKMPSAGP